MWGRVILFVSMFSLGVHGQFPFTFGFNPVIFENQLENMLTSLTANIFLTQRAIADSVRRAQASGRFFRAQNLRPGEFRRFTGPRGRRGFAFRSLDGQSSGFGIRSGGQGSGYFFTRGPGGFRLFRF